MLFLLFIFVFLIINNSTDKILSVNLCKKCRPTFAEIFGKEWENEIIRENENENETNQIETDQKANFHQSDQNELSEQLDNQKKCGIIHRSHAIKEGIKKMGKYSKKDWNKIELKIAKKLEINRPKIYKWKKELKINKNKSNENNYYKKKKMEFNQRIDEFKRTYENGKEKQFAKELGISQETLRKWKKEFGIEIGKRPIRLTEEEKRSKMNDYYKLKKTNPFLTNQKIAGLLNIGITTLKTWKKENNS